MRAALYTHSSVVRCKNCFKLSTYGGWGMSRILKTVVFTFALLGTLCAVRGNEDDSDSFLFGEKTHPRGPVTIVEQVSPTTAVVRYGTQADVSRMQFEEKQRDYANFLKTQERRLQELEQRRAQSQAQIDALRRIELEYAKQHPSPMSPLLQGQLEAQARYEAEHQRTQPTPTPSATPVPSPSATAQPSPIH
jgi:hypothetical protein